MLFKNCTTSEPESSLKIFSCIAVHDHQSTPSRHAHSLKLEISFPAFIKHMVMHCRGQRTGHTLKLAASYKLWLAQERGHMFCTLQAFIILRIVYCGFVAWLRDSCRLLEFPKAIVSQVIWWFRKWAEFFTQLWTGRFNSIWALSMKATRKIFVCIWSGPDNW